MNQKYSHEHLARSEGQAAPKHTIVLLAIRANEKGSTFKWCAGDTQLLDLWHRVREWRVVLVRSRRRGGVVENAHRRRRERVVDPPCVGGDRVPRMEGRSHPITLTRPFDAYLHVDMVSIPFLSAASP